MRFQGCIIASANCSTAHPRLSSVHPRQPRRRQHGHRTPLQPAGAEMRSLAARTARGGELHTISCSFWASARERFPPGLGLELLILPRRRQAARRRCSAPNTGARGARHTSAGGPTTFFSPCRVARPPRAIIQQLPLASAAQVRRRRARHGDVCGASHRCMTSRRRDGFAPPD
ncbi:hypothetical protein BU26DRAFT_6841 [Trematosphaeria pertusa]|uniref:Uncharacterized protein n=1 Tax=Trematosphaeria pertusa TaxID=390896 RepID=A0A6A6J091_9PLEO|nr:uncharacterized protein BU26DRAFT_6841 [Trematosphaeria pertusa]KAF2255727.1 hypothetical protein BU26DRAFT_6841 [Trematosphaeria pertusa]